MDGFADVSEKQTLWHIDFPNIEDPLKYMYQHNIHCDVTIQATDVRDGSSMCFNAHKLILATRSPVFADIFFHRTHKNKILLVKCNPRALDILLWYIYTDKVETDDIDELIESFDVATTYEVFSFWEICAVKLHAESAKINSSNVCSVMNIAILSKSNLLQTICLRIIQEDLENVFVSDDFLTLNENTVWDLLKDSKLNICLQQMLKTIMKWMKNKKVTDRKFLSFIDFSVFNADDFLNIVEEFPYFFSGSEIRAILSKLTLENPPGLPAWCSFSKANTNDKCPPLHFLYEGMELIRNCATKVQTDCNRSFNKITLHSLDGFEQEMLLKIIMKCRTLKLVMIELAFGSEFVPLDCLVIELYSNLNPEKKMKTLKFNLIPSVKHYYLLFDGNFIPSLHYNFNLLLVVKAFGLLEWRLQSPVSNQKFRVASVSHCSEIKTVDAGMIQVVQLKPFLDWLLFINPSNGVKQFVVSTLYFDTLENVTKHLKHLDIDHLGNKS